MAALEARRAGIMAESAKRAHERREALLAESKEKAGAHESSIATLRAQLDEAGRAQHTRGVVDQMKQEAREAEARSAALTAALTRLDALKVELLADLPLPAGVEFRDGDIYVGGVPFDRVNRAQQVGVVMAIAAMRAGDLGLVVMDGLECLDETTFGAFCAWAERNDKLQLVVTRVSNGPLAVEVLA
jgi:hypothetical protein